MTNIQITNFEDTEDPQYTNELYEYHKAKLHAQVYKLPFTKDEELEMKLGLFEDDPEDEDKEPDDEDYKCQYCNGSGCNTCLMLSR